MGELQQRTMIVVGWENIQSLGAHTQATFLKVESSHKPCCVGRVCGKGVHCGTVWHSTEGKGGRLSRTSSASLSYNTHGERAWAKCFNVLRHRHGPLTLLLLSPWCWWW